MGLFSRWAINILFISCIAVYGVGLFLDVMEVDAAQYASISSEMATTGEYLQVKSRGQDYLDKPPLLFWISSIWIKWFGPHNWAFKLSSFLFSILGIVSTYKLGHLLYNKRIGFVAAIMLATCQAYFLFNHDVRTDTILTAAVIFGVWQIMAFIFYRDAWHLIGGFFGIGLGMLTKGPIALMVPVLAFGSYFIGRKRYKDLFRWEWLAGIAIVLVMLSPMLYGLYEQYDKHPEKEMVFISDAGGRTETGVSGIKFYFWTQSFGRITGENVWKDNSPPTYFIDTFLWSFLPWAMLAVWAIIWRMYNTSIDLFKNRKKQEWLTLGGFVLPFIAFSTSSYKLPHYIFVLFPFAAIITAEFVLRVLFEKPRWWGNIMLALQSIVIAGLATVILLLLVVAFPTKNILVWAGFLGLMGVAVASLFSKTRVNQIVVSSALAIIAGNWVLNTHVYPQLFKYQPGKWAAEYVLEKNLPKEQLFIGPGHGFFSYCFYADGAFAEATEDNIRPLLSHGKPVWVYANEEYFEYYKAKYPNVQAEAVFPSYHISQLTPAFLNPATREAQIKKQYLVKIEGE